MSKRRNLLGNKYAVGNEGGGRPLTWLRDACRAAAWRIGIVEILEKAAQEKNGRDRIRAIEMLCDRGWGKAEQSIDVTTHDSERPSTDVLIQTITALRAELDSLRKGAELAGTK